MSYSYQSGAKTRKKAQKEKQFLSNYAKHSSICNWIKRGNSSLRDPCERGPELLLLPGPECSLNGPVNHLGAPLTSKL